MMSYLVKGNLLDLFDGLTTPDLCKHVLLDHCASIKDLGMSKSYKESPATFAGIHLAPPLPNLLDLNNHRNRMLN